MTLDQFVALRKTLGLTQSGLADHLGMKLRGVQDIEGGKSPLRTIHVLAIQRLSLSIGSAIGNVAMIDPTTLAEAKLAAATAAAARSQQE